MIKWIPHASTYIPKHISFMGDPIDLSDKHVLEIFGQAGALVFPFSRLYCDVERLKESEPMEELGMGICYTKNANLEFLRSVSKQEREQIVRDYYDPIHERLERLTEKEIEKYGEAVVIDCHTFRKEPWPYEDETLYRPEICIGYDEPSWVSGHIWQTLKDKCDVGVNTPFSGAIKPLKYISDDRVKSVMIEVRQDMPINEIKEDIQAVLRHVSEWQGDL